MKEFAQTATIGQVNGPERNEQSYIMYKLVDRTSAADSVKLQMIPLPQDVYKRQILRLAYPCFDFRLQR